jgi:hypothetical protein
MKGKLKKTYIWFSFFGSPKLLKKEIKKKNKRLSYNGYFTTGMVDIL